MTLSLDATSTRPSGAGSCAFLGVLLAVGACLICVTGAAGASARVGVIGALPLAIGVPCSRVGGENEEGEYAGVVEGCAGENRTALVVVGPTLAVPAAAVSAGAAAPALTVRPGVANAFCGPPLVWRDEGAEKDAGWLPSTRNEADERRSAGEGVCSTVEAPNEWSMSASVVGVLIEAQGSSSGSGKVR